MSETKVKRSAVADARLSDLIHKHVQTVIHEQHPKALLTWSADVKSTRTDFTCASATPWTLKQAEDLLTALTKDKVRVNDLRWNVQDKFALVVDVMDSNHFHDLETAMEDRTLLQATALSREPLGEFLKREEALMKLQSDIAKEDRPMLANLSTACYKMQGQATPTNMRVVTRLHSEGLYSLECIGLKSISLKHMRFLASMAPFQVNDIVLNADPVTFKSDTKSSTSPRVIVLCSSLKSPVQFVWHNSGIEQLSINDLDQGVVPLTRKSWRESDLSVFLV
jgi:hypothetical protein